ncbi:protein GLUTAMINE DUMPER 6-like [Cocos nucifera]|uniref:Protein GLUTAMINE DUMPER 6-like n=1 Tax=Cocos nucifera TaxID=13894 RepID=A0A8K0HUM9_COCNU|nr:protein GLUTAMINE DUMPER 6-like [Cocos nucifera]
MGSENLQSATGSNLWHTPIPYLFGGLGAMMVLIAIALIVLACSHRGPSTDRDPESVEKPATQPLDMEPRILVIMAGDDKPTYLATPISSIQHAQQQPSYLPSSCEPKQDS